MSTIARRLGKLEQVAGTAAVAEIPGLPPFSQWSLADLLIGLDFATRDNSAVTDELLASLEAMDRDEAQARQFRESELRTAAVEANRKLNQAGPEVRLPANTRWPALVANAIWHERAFPSGLGQRPSMFFDALPPGVDTGPGGPVLGVVTD